MFHYFKKNIFLTILFCAYSLTSYAQWAKGKGKGYYKVSAWYLEADQHYTDTGAIDPNVTRGQFNINFYGVHGLTNKLDAIVYFPFFSRAYENNVVSGTTGKLVSSGEAINSIGDLDLGVEYMFLKTKNVVLSSSFILGLPTGNNSGGSDGSFQTGDGEFNQLLKVNLGIPFKLSKASFYSKTYLGFNNRTEGFSDEFRAGLEIGTNFFNEKVWINAKIDVLKSLQNGSLNAQNSQGSIFANNIEYTGIGSEIAYYFTKKFGISVNYGGAIGGRVIYARPSLSAGLFLDIK